MAGMTASPLDLFKPIAGRALEAALNRALALDPDTRDAIGALQGRRIGLALESPPLALELRVDDAGRLRVGPPDAAPEPDLAVRGSLTGLLAQLPFFAESAARRARPGAAPAAPGRVRVSGDAELARQLQRLAERFDPDWERPFTAVFGDLVGVQLADAARRALRHARGAAGDLARTAVEYATEESRDLVPRAELDAFHDDVDAVHDGVERLAARVERVRRAAATAAPAGGRDPYLAASADGAA